MRRSAQLPETSSTGTSDHGFGFSSVAWPVNAPPPVASLAQLPGIIRVEELGHGRFRLHHAPGAAPHQAVLERAGVDGWDLWEITPEHAGLEQIFVDLTLGEAPV